MTLPVFLILLGAVIACMCDKSSSGEGRGTGAAICLWLLGFLIAGLCSLIGAILMFLAAADPPPQRVYNRNSYVAFAAFAGIFALIAGIAYCGGMCGYFSKESCDKKEETKETV